MVDAPPRRTRFRFSLRTLLLAALLWGSGMLLWHNREPWQVRLTIREESAIHKSGFSPHDTYFYTCTFTSRDQGEPQEVIHIYDRETGRAVRTLTSGLPVIDSDYQSFEFSPGERYVYRLVASSTRLPYASLKEVWQVQNGEKLQFNAIKPGQRLFDFSPRDRFVSIGSDTSFKWIAVASQLPFKQLGHEEGGCFSPDEKWLACYPSPTCWNIELISSETGAVAVRIIPDQAHYCYFSSDSQILFVACGKSPALVTRLYDVHSGNSLGEVRGRDAQLSEDGLFLAAYLRHDERNSSGKCNDEAIVYDRATLHERTRVHLMRSSETVRVTGNRVLAESPLRIYELATGELIWKSSLVYGEFSNGAYAYEHQNIASLPEKSASVELGFLVDAFTGERMQAMTLPREDYVHNGPSFKLHFAREHAEILTACEAPATTKANLNRQVQLWRCRRPGGWHGYAWLPEFWLSVGLLGGLVWSVVRDRR